jgi:catechol 2,3-dioxygenase-like lactoylglutathione lyase family enzyme
VLNSLDHVVVAVSDLEAATATYQRLLGRTPSWRGTHPVLGTANSLFRLSNTYLELLAPDGSGTLAEALRTRLALEGEGILGLAFGTPDAAACAAEFRASGLPAADPGEGVGRDSSTGAVRTWRSVLLPASATRGIVIFAIEHRSPPEALPAGLPDGAQSEIVSGLDHVVVASADLDAAAALYRDQLRLRLALDRRFEQRGLRLLFFRVGGVTVELAGQLAGAPDRGAPDRATGLAWRTEDVAAARARLAAAGFEVSEVRRGQKRGTQVCTVRRETYGVNTLLIGPDPRTAPMPGAR